MSGAMDEQVARRVFGWEPCPGPVIPCKVDGWGDVEEDEHCASCDWASFWYRPHEEYGIREYSESMDFAWEVVEEMRKWGWRFDLRSDEHTDACRFWGGFYETEWVEGDSTPENICHAALAALDIAAIKL